MRFPTILFAFFFLITTVEAVLRLQFHRDGCFEQFDAYGSEYHACIYPGIEHIDSNRWIRSQWPAPLPSGSFLNFTLVNPQVISFVRCDDNAATINCQRYETQPFNSCNDYIPGTAATCMPEYNTSLRCFQFADGFIHITQVHNTFCSFDSTTLADDCDNMQFHPAYHGSCFRYGVENDTCIDGLTCMFAYPERTTVYDTTLTTVDDLTEDETSSTTMLVSTCLSLIFLFCLMIV